MVQYPSFWYMDREEALTYSPRSSLTCLFATKSLKCMPPEETKLREGSAVCQALCT